MFCCEYCEIFKSSFFLQNNSGGCSVSLLSTSRQSSNAWRKFAFLKNDKNCFYLLNKLKKKNFYDIPRPIVIFQVLINLYLTVVQKLYFLKCGFKKSTTTIYFLQYINFSSLNILLQDITICQIKRIETSYHATYVHVDLELCSASMMELFEKIVNGIQLLPLS